jgi:hypothetical protein
MNPTRELELWEKVSSTHTMVSDICIALKQIAYSREGIPDSVMKILEKYPGTPPPSKEDRIKSANEKAERVVSLLYNHPAYNSSHESNIWEFSRLFYDRITVPSPDKKADDQDYIRQCQDTWDRYKEWMACGSIRIRFRGW